MSREDIPKRHGPGLESHYFCDVCCDCSGYLSCNQRCFRDTHCTVMTVFIFAAHIAFPSYGVWTLVPALIMIFGEGFVIFSSANEEIITNRAVMVVAAVFATLMSVTASAHHHRARYQSFQAMRKVKMLSGLLPICASCKKIRDDQGYYQQIEL